MTEAKTRIRIMTDAGVISDPEWQGSRITDMIYESMLWTQGQLLKLNKNYWLTEATAGGVAGGSLQKITCTKISESELATNMNWEVPIVSFSHADYTNVARPVDLANWVFINNNLVLKPSVLQPVFCQVGKDAYLFPALLTVPTYLYTRVTTKPTYNNDTDDIDVPDQYIEMVIDRVAMQIKQVQGNLQGKQMTMADIDSFIQKKYQLAPVDTNRKVTQ